jgi:hypothetical protein
MMGSLVTVTNHVRINSTIFTFDCSGIGIQGMSCPSIMPTVQAESSYMMHSLPQ